MWGAGAPKRRRRFCAAMPRSAVAPNRGAAHAKSRPGSRPALTRDSQHLGSRHPLRGQQPGQQQCRLALGHTILRARLGQKPHQVAQGPARLRPHQLPVRAGQSGPPRAAHRRLVVNADGARRHPKPVPTTLTPSISDLKSQPQAKRQIISRAQHDAQSSIR